MQRHPAKTTGQNDQLREIGEAFALTIRDEDTRDRRTDPEGNDRRRGWQLLETEHLCKSVRTTGRRIDSQVGSLDLMTSSRMLKPRGSACVPRARG